MVVWFLTIAALGSWEILQSPRIPAGPQPWYAWEFFSANHLHGFVVLGSVVLCITGGEALYADLGHFGRRAIRITWLGWPAPPCCSTISGSAPCCWNTRTPAFTPSMDWFLRRHFYPMVALSTIATVIAFSGADFGRLFPDATGHSPRLQPRCPHRSHIRGNQRTESTSPVSNYALYDRLPGPGSDI